jgi:hypothetical protein
MRGGERREGVEERQRKKREWKTKKRRERERSGWSIICRDN